MDKLNRCREADLKILSWNVNGLRAILRKNAWEWVGEQAADIVCLQEIKMKPEQMPAENHALFDDLTLLWHPAEKPGYSGVLTMMRNPADENRVGLEIPDFDREGRALLTRFGDIWIANVYVPNGKRDHSRVAYKLDFYQELLTVCNQLIADGQGVVICGDINTAHQEIDLANPRENQNTTGFLPEERVWISNFIENGYRDIWRDLHPEKIQYTWWSYPTFARARNVGWRIDFFLVSENIISRVSSASIYDEVEGSDHCPIGLEIDYRDDFSNC